MRFKLLRQGALLWLVIAFVCFLFGALDDLVLFPRIGEIAIPISGVAMSIVIFCLTFFVLPKLTRTTVKGYWLLGMFWLTITIIFECSEAVIIEHASWREIFAAYNPLTGNLWLLVIMTVFFSPRIAAGINHLCTDGKDN